MNIVITLISVVIFIISLIFTIFINNKSKGLYDEYVESLDENEHKLKKFIPIGIYINENYSLIDKLPKFLKKILTF